MKKIVSRQVPKAKIIRVAAGSLLLSLAAGEAEAQGCVTGANPPPQQSSPPVTTTSPAQTAISGDRGCVSGAQDYQRPQQQPRR